MAISMVRCLATKIGFRLHNMTHFNHFSLSRVLFLCVCVYLVMQGEKFLCDSCYPAPAPASVPTLGDSSVPSAPQVAVKSEAPKLAPCKCTCAPQVMFHIH